MRVFIAGPLTDKDSKRQLKNVEFAIRQGIEVFKRGHIPLIPHLTHYVDEMTEALTYDDYIKWSTELLKLCDCMLYLGDSKGANIELKMAKSLYIQVFYSIDDIPDLKGGEIDDSG